MVRLLALASIFAAACAATSTRAGDAPETDLGILGAAIRDRGMRCERPGSVERDDAASLPDRPAWIVQCENARYRVIFEGDIGARVSVVK